MEAGVMTLISHCTCIPAYARSSSMMMNLVMGGANSLFLAEHSSGLPWWWRARGGMDSQFTMVSVDRDSYVESIFLPSRLQNTSGFGLPENFKFTQLLKAFFLLV